MKALIQRVKCGKVFIDGQIFNEISAGLVILLGVSVDDSDKETDLLAEKTVNLRVMSDEAGKMNRSIVDTKGEILVVSQFTLYADLTAGRRPSFLQSAKAEVAEQRYLKYIENLNKLGVRKVVSGKFGAYMMVEIHNDGPVTIMINSEDFKN